MKLIIATKKGEKRPLVFLVPDRFKLDTVEQLVPDKVSKEFTLVEIDGDEINVTAGEVDVMDVLRKEVFPVKEKK